MVKKKTNLKLHSYLFRHSKYLLIILIMNIKHYLSKPLMKMYFFKSHKMVSLDIGKHYESRSVFRNSSNIR